MPREGKKQLKVWLDLDDHEAVKRNAQAGDLSVSDYVRKRCAGAAPKRRTRHRADVQELHRIQGELGKIGSNLNQLARIANQTGRLAPVNVLERLRYELHAVALQVDRALGYEPASETPTER